MQQAPKHLFDLPETSPWKKKRAPKVNWKRLHKSRERLRRKPSGSGRASNAKPNATGRGCAGLVGGRREGWNKRTAAYTCRSAGVGDASEARLAGARDGAVGREAEVGASARQRGTPDTGVRERESDRGGGCPPGREGERRRAAPACWFLRARSQPKSRIPVASAPPIEGNRRIEEIRSLTWLPPGERVHPLSRSFSLALPCALATLTRSRQQSHKLESTRGTGRPVRVPASSFLSPTSD